MHRILNKVSRIIAVILTVVFIGMIHQGFPDWFFLESNHPLYYKLFGSNESLLSRYNTILPDSDNLLPLNILNEADNSGIELHRSNDGSIAISGCNLTGKSIYVHLSAPNAMLLINGTYKISYNNNGSVVDNTSFYFEGRNKTPQGVEYTMLGDVSENPVFKLNNEDYESFALVLAFAPGFESEETVTIYPQIRRVDDPLDEYEPPAILKTTVDEGVPAFQTFLVDKAEFNQLTNDDWRIFNNNLKYQYYGSYIWTTIVFEDGTGVQFTDSDPDQAVYGLVDPWGRVEKPLYEVHSLDEIKAACLPV